MTNTRYEIATVVAASTRLARGVDPLQVADAIISSGILIGIRADAYDRAAAEAFVYHDGAYCPPNPYREESESEGKPGYL